MPIIAKFTRTLPAPTATISDGFVFLLSAGWFTQANTGAAGSPIDGGANSIANGGGDMQIFSDTATTTRLPIEVVTFVTGGSPQCQVWVRTPSYTSGDTITIGKDDTQTTQPAVGAAFGRNAAWADNVSTYHGNSLVDSSGNNDLTAYNSPLVDVAGRIGGAFDFTAASSQYMDSSSISGVVGDDITLIAWVKPKTDTGSGQGILSLRSNPANTTTAMWQRLTLQDNAAGNPVRGQYTKIGGNSIVSDTIAASVGVWSMVATSMDGSSSISTYVNGANKVISSGGSISSNASHLYLGAWQSTNAPILQYADALIESSMYIKGKKTDAFISSVYTNQSDPDNFGTSSEYVLVGGGGISILTDFDVRYSIESSLVSVVTDFDIRYSMLNELTTDFDIRYSMLNELTTDFDIRYSIAVNIVTVTTDFDVRYIMLNSVTTDFDIRYSMLNGVSTDFDVRYNIDNSFAIATVRNTYTFNSSQKEYNF